MSWREIKTQADIDEFMEKNGDLHDSVIVSVNYVSGCHDTDGSYMIVSSPRQCSATHSGQRLVRQNRDAFQRGGLPCGARSC